MANKKTSRKKKKISKRKKITKNEAFKIHSRRSIRSQRVDNKTTEKIVDDERYRKNPKFYDYKGVDTARKTMPDIPKTVDMLTADLKKDKKLYNNLKKLPKNYDKYTADQSRIIIDKNLKKFKKLSSIIGKIRDDRNTKIITLKNQLDSQIDNKTFMLEDIINSTKKRHKPLSIKESHKKQNKLK